MGKIKNLGLSVKNWGLSIKNLGLSVPDKKKVLVNTAIAAASMGIVATIIYLMDLAVVFVMK